MQDLPFSSRFAVYSDNQRKLWLLASWERVLVLLKPGQSDLFTVAPLQSNGHVDFAPIGLTNMLNAGGAILEWNAAEIASDSEFRFKVLLIPGCSVSEAALGLRPATFTRMEK